MSVSRWGRSAPGVVSWARAVMLALLVLGAAACGGGDDDDRLEDLQLSDATLNPDFDPDVFDYTAEVDHEVASVTVTPTAEDSASTVQVNGTLVDSGTASPPIDLVVGENRITVVVTAGDDDRETYLVVVTRLPPPGDDPSLASLALVGAPLDQIFDGDVTSYTASIGHFGAATRVIAEPVESRAQMQLDGESLLPGEASAYLPLEVGENVAEIDVTAEDGSATRRYEVVVERAERNTLRQEAYLKASNTGPDLFGASVSVFGDSLAVGAPSEGSASAGVDGDQDDNSFDDAGAVYVFDRSGSTWVQSAYLKASNPGDPDLFGGAVAIDGDRLLVGAEGEQSLATGIDGDEDDDSSSFVGAAYVFERDGMGVWEQTAYLKASNADGGDGFGAFLDLDGDRALVGAWSEDSGSVGVDGDGANDDRPGAGAAYVFRVDADGEWAEEAYLKASNTDAEDEFGSAVSISGRHAAVGAPREDSSATGVGGSQTSNVLSSAGAVYLFEADDDGAWSQTVYLKASNTDAGDFFGASVSLDGDLLAVGAPGEDGGLDAVDGDQQDDSVEDAGAVYVFQRDGDDWSQVAYLKAADPGVNDAFGLSVVLRGNTLAVAAPGESSAAVGLDGDERDDSLSDAGAVYVFERDPSGDWQPVSYVKASNTDAGDEFGTGLDFHGDTLAVGAAFEDGGDTGVDGNDSDDSVADAGAVYVIR